MIAPAGKPDPELLAAYLDGEFEGRDGMEDLRRRVESWLESDATARKLVGDYRRLRHVWTDTSPDEPTARVWAKLLDRIERRPLPGPSRARRWGVRLGALAASALAAALVFLSLIPLFHGPDVQTGSVSVGPLGPGDDAADDFILPVARADEVSILQVEGNDTSTLVVGRLPVHGPLELVSTGDFVVSSMEPAEDSMLPQIRIGTRSPMIWARAGSD